MNKKEYTILKKNIHNVKIVGYTSQSWYDNNGNIVPWIGLDENKNPYDLTPLTSSFYYNTGSSIPDGYYKWNGATWTGVTSGSIQNEYNIPLFLDANLDEMGGMVSFADEHTSGFLEQVDQIVNFIYSQTGSLLKVYSSVNPDKLRTIVEQNYTIDWGDGTSGSFPINSGSVGTSLPFVTHSYTANTKHTVSVYLESPWTKQKVTKTIDLANPYTGTTNTLGTYTYTGPNIGQYPYIGAVTGGIDYLNNLDNTNITGNTTFSFALLGGSRIGELKNYGETTVVGANTGSVDENGYKITGYTIDGLYYMDYIDGYTVITGSTTGFTKEEVFNKMLTRNEHFLGFIDDPVVYSDIFVERGKSGVAEFNLRLGEIDNMDELEIYGNGFFTVKKT